MARTTFVFDDRGWLYLSDPWRPSLENPIGGFYRLLPDGRIEQLDTGLAFPNGVALAPDGRDILDPSGSIVARIPTPGAKPTNVAFGGNDGRTLIVTEVETASVYRGRVRVPGLPLFGQS